jgi:8-oxo-dGTP pyrophosphatase MutT (NUDIX family)
MAFSEHMMKTGNLPSPPRDAAAVILIRERVGSGEAEVFMLRRHDRASFMARSFVFPGGIKDSEDSSLEETAVRELSEEAGVQIPPKSLHYFAHWITPSFEKKRYSARFFVGELPPGQVPSFDDVETVEEVWVTPAEAVARASDLRLPPPQLHTMYNLRNAAANGPAAVLDLASAGASHPHPIMPKGLEIPGTPPRFAVLLPWDPDYAFIEGEGIEIDPTHPVATGPSRLILGDDGWQLADDSSCE